MKVADIYTYKNGKKKIEFFLLGIYELIKNELGFRYSTIDGKGYYFENKEGTYVKSSFLNIRDAFKNHITSDFESLEIINYKEFLNAFYEKAPLKNGHFSKTYLSEDFELSENEFHLFNLETNFSYSYGIERKKMNEFIKQEEFIPTKNFFGNFFNIDSKVFYKKVKENLFLILYYTNWNNEKVHPAFNLYKVNAKNELDLFMKTDKEIKDFIIGFSIHHDWEFYNEKKSDQND